MPVSFARPSAVGRGPYLSDDEAATLYARIDGLPLNVRDYGATGDGTTNDTAAIQATLNAVPASGGTVYFPPGSYKVSTGLTVTKPTTIRGAGATDAYLDHTVSRVFTTSATIHLFTVSAKGSTFADLHIDNTAATEPSAGSGVRITAGDGQRFRNVTVSGFYDCIRFEDGGEWWLTDSLIQGPARYGLYIAHTDLPDGGDFTVSGCIFNADDYSADALIYWASGDGVKITDCKFNTRGDGSVTDAIRVAATDAATSGLFQLANSSLENFTRYGLYITTDADCTFSQVSVLGCEFSGGLAGIKADSSAGSSPSTQYRIVGNEFDAGGSTVNAVDLNATRYVAVTGNSFYGTGSDATAGAVKLTACQDVAVTGNTTLGYTRVVTRSGTNTRVRLDYAPPAVRHGDGLGVHSSTSTTYAAVPGMSITLPNVAVGDTVNVRFNAVCYGDADGDSIKLRFTANGTHIQNSNGTEQFWIAKFTPAASWYLLHVDWWFPVTAGLIATANEITVVTEWAKESGTGVKMFNNAAVVPTMSLCNGFGQGY